MVIALAFGAALIVLWMKTSPDPSERQPLVAAVRQHHIVQAVEFSAKVWPRVATDIIAPFDGVLLERNFNWGDELEKDSKAFSLSTEELDREIREARVQLGILRSAAARLKGWANGAEVQRARRVGAAAERQLADASRRRQDVQRLFHLGIVPRLEFEAAQTDERQSQDAVLTARSELESVGKQVEPSELQRVELDVDNATVRLARLVSDREKNPLRLPDGGTVAQPPLKIGVGLAPVEPGSRVRRGDVLGRVQKAGDVVVLGDVEEFDVIKLRSGQVATISFPALVGRMFRGHVASVSALPSNVDSQQSNDSSRYQVRITLRQLTLEELGLIRPGMKAQVTVETYASEKALVLPVEAVQKDEKGPFVVVPSGTGATPHRVDVKTGTVTVEFIEILEPLQLGDEVLMGARTPAAAATP